MIVTVEVLLQLRMARCVQQQTHACCHNYGWSAQACYHNYGWPGVHDSRRVNNVVTVGVLRRVRMTVDACAAETTDGQVHTTAHARVPQ